MKVEEELAVKEEVEELEMEECPLQLHFLHNCTFCTRSDVIWMSR